MFGVDCVSTVASVPRPQSVYLEDLTWMEVRDAIAAGKTTVIIPTGNLYGSLYPSDRLRSEVRNFSYRRTSFGIDWRGTTIEEKYWRYFGAISAFENYHYETESREVAEVFDRILDRVCFRAKK